MAGIHTAHRVLIVHREPGVAANLRQALADQGYDVACAASADEARAVGRAFAPDLLVIDPGLAGLDALGGETAIPPGRDALCFEDLLLNESAHEVTRGGRPLELTATEFRLLRFLMSHPDRVLTRAQLLEHVWAYDFGGDARVLETYISYLRRKLEAHGDRLIHTVRGVGYALRAPRGRQISSPRHTLARHLGPKVSSP